jgi:hypothetical protein
MGRTQEVVIKVVNAEITKISYMAAEVMEEHITYIITVVVFVLFFIVSL